MDVVSDDANHLGPVELITNVLDHLGSAWVASKAVVMVRVKDI